MYAELFPLHFTSFSSSSEFSIDQKKKKGDAGGNILNNFFLH
jgi:hypothetical protein